MAVSLIGRKTARTVKILRGMSPLMDVFASTFVYSLVFLETDGDKMP